MAANGANILWFVGKKNGALLCVNGWRSIAMHVRNMTPAEQMLPHLAPLICPTNSTGFGGNMHFRVSSLKLTKNFSFTSNLGVCTLAVSYSFGFVIMYKTLECWCKNIGLKCVPKSFLQPKKSSNNFWSFDKSLFYVTFLLFLPLPEIPPFSTRTKWPRSFSPSFFAAHNNIMIKCERVWGQINGIVSSSSRCSFWSSLCSRHMMFPDLFSDFLWILLSRKFRNGISV